MNTVRQYLCDGKLYTFITIEDPMDCIVLERPSDSVNSSARKAFLPPDRNLLLASALQLCESRKKRTYLRSKMDNKSIVPASLTKFRS